MREAEKMGGGGRELGWLEAAILIGSILTFIVDQATGEVIQITRIILVNLLIHVTL
jgi:hypothetical protein